MSWLNVEPIIISAYRVGETFPRADPVKTLDAERITINAITTTKLILLILPFNVNNLPLNF
jgi:hypothetical protein